MKKYLSFVLLLFFTVFYSQEYVPLLKEGNKWYEKNMNYTPDGYGDVSYTYIFINGEEIINGKSYKKLFSNLYCHSWLHPFPCNTTGNADQFYKFLREDLNERKVYFYDEATNSEVLLYDFSLNVGDLLPMNFPYRANNSSHNPDSSVPITQIVKNGSAFNQTVPYTYLTQEVNNNNYTLNAKVYEGIGSNNGLLYIPGQPIFEGGNILECFESVASGKSCNSIFLSSKESLNLKTFDLIYLKNFNSYVVTGKSSEKVLLQLFDFSGKLVQEKQVNSNERFQLNNVSKSSSYLYQLNSSKGNFSGKIIIP